MNSRKHPALKLVVCVLIVISLDAVCVKAAAGRPVAHTPEHKVVSKARTASVSWKWEPILEAYTGGNYGVGHVNSLWPMAPHGKRRQIVLRAAVHHHVPLRLLLGIWGAESTFGHYACHFGLTGYFPGTGTSGDFRRDAHLAAALLDRLYRIRYHHHAI
jgi:hypothetical protein